MLIWRWRYVGTRQEIASKSDFASEPATYPAVAVPNAGEKFSDEDLHARFNVPAWGGIRVSRDKKCIVLVDLVVRSGYEDVDHGHTVSYMGQNSDREGMQNQEMSTDAFPTIPSKTEPADPGRRQMQATSNNLSLSRSKEEGYTVLYFTREWGVDDLRFDSRVECDSHRFVVEERDDRQPRVVIKFELRRVAGTPGAAAGGAGPAPVPHGAHRGETGGAPGVSGHVAGIPGSARPAIGGPTQAQAPFGAPLSAERPAAPPLPREAQARLELDDSAGSFMRDAIARGGYRAALHYYGSDEAKKFNTPSSAVRSTPPIISHGSDEAKESDTPWHRLRMQGWLLGRLGLYGQMKGWLEDASAWPDFDDVLNAADRVQHLPYKTPAAWLRAPAPAPLSADRIMTLEPAAPPCRDIGSVPDYVWTAMLILDAVGPICSHAGFGAAAFLVAAGADKQARGAARRGGGMYDPRRGARLHGAPEGCHRWIIADIDFDPRPSNEPHYYDLTDEGRKILASARAAGAPWPKATEKAVAGLSGMALPDLLEGACRLAVPVRGLDEMRGELGRLADAWRAQDAGVRAPPVSAADRVLVDLGLTAGRSDTGEAAGSSLDHFLYLVSVVDSTCAVACEAEPSTRGESAVLETLIAAIQDMCRGHGRAVAAAAASTAGPTLAPALGGSVWKGGGAGWRPQYADAAPVMISDLYYCLAEYCRSRRLAVDPCSLPLSEALSEDQKAAVAEVLMDDSAFWHGED